MNTAKQIVSNLLEDALPLEERGYSRESWGYLKRFGTSEILVYIESGWVDVDVVIGDRRGRLFRISQNDINRLLDEVEPIAAAPGEEKVRYEVLRQLDIPYAQAEVRDEKPIHQWADELGWNVDVQRPDDFERN